MDDLDIDFYEGGVGDPSEAQRARIERFRDRIEELPKGLPRALRTFRRGSALLGLWST